MLSLPGEKLQRDAAQRIIALRLSVRQAEAMCKRMAAGEQKAGAKQTPVVNYLAECEKTLTRRLGRKVRITDGKKKGQFILEFYGAEDLQRLYDALCAMTPEEEHEN